MYCTDSTQASQANNFCYRLKARASLIHHKHARTTCKRKVVIRVIIKRKICQNSSNWTCSKRGRSRFRQTSPDVSNMTWKSTCLPVCGLCVQNDFSRQAQILETNPGGDTCTQVAGFFSHDKSMFTGLPCFKLHSSKGRTIWLVRALSLCTLLRFPKRFKDGIIIFLTCIHGASHHHWLQKQKTCFPCVWGDFDEFRARLDSKKLASPQSLPDASASLPNPAAHRTTHRVCNPQTRPPAANTGLPRQPPILSTHKCWL